MFSKWQRKYEEEAERLVEVLRRWFELESEIKRLEWELARCQNPEAYKASVPEPARKPALLRRAEAGKSVVPGKKRGVEQSWKNRHKEVSTFRENYEVLASRLTIRVERLTKQLADCSASREKRADGAGQRAAQPAVEPAKNDPYERMPPAMKRMRGQLEKMRKADQASRPSWSRREAEVQTLEAPPVGQEKPVEQEKPLAPEKRVEQEKPVTQATPETTPALPPRQELRRPEAAPWKEKYQALEQEHAALKHAMEEMELQLKQVTARLKTRERELDAGREAAEALTQKEADTRHAFEAMHQLTKHFRQGQRSFLAHPDAPDVGTELAGLIYYALTHLTLALVSGERVRARAMYANLHTIARNLQSYKLTTLHGFDAALEVLHILPGGDAARYAEQLRRSPQSPGSEARPIRACLKTMRDKASVELRPFFFDIDQEGEVITIG